MRKILLSLLGFVIFYLTLHLFSNLTAFSSGDESKYYHKGYVSEFAGVELIRSAYDSSGQARYTISSKDVSISTIELKDEFYLYKNGSKIQVYANPFENRLELPINKQEYNASKILIFTLEKLFQISFLIISLLLFKTVYSIKKDMYDISNLKRIKAISMIIIVLGIFSFCRKILILTYFSKFLKFAGIYPDNDIYQLLPVTLIIGLFLYSTLYVYKKAIELKNEQNLII